MPQIRLSWLGALSSFWLLSPALPAYADRLCIIAEGSGQVVCGTLVQEGASFLSPSGAGTITLYEHGNRQGSSITLLRDHPNLESVGMANKVSSAIVQSGVWQICSAANYGCRCVVLTPGQYEMERFNLNDQVNSVRRLR